MVTPGHPNYPEQQAQDNRLTILKQQIQQDRIARHNERKQGQ